MALRRGDTGDTVRTLQAELRACVFAGLEETSVFDLNTDLAVRAFQAWNLLPADGVVGKATWDALDNPRIKGDTGSLFLKKLDVPYFSQRDNQYNPSGTCNVTSLAMALTGLGIKRRTATGQFEDELYEFLHTDVAAAAYKRSAPTLYEEGVPPQHVHAMLAWAAREYGATKTEATMCTIGGVAQEVSRGAPVLLSGRFTGSGHIVLAVGVTSGASLLVHDPWGDWNQAYKNRDGEYRIYTYEALHDVLNPTGRDDKYVTVVR